MPSIEIPEIDAGLMDRRVTILKPLYGVGDDGETVDWGEIIGWETIATVWAAVTPRVATEQSEAGRTVAVAQVMVQIRYRADIDHRWRVQDRNRIYQIDGMVDVLRRHVQWQLTCKEVE